MDLIADIWRVDGYARERFWQPADGLVGDGIMQERLANAAMILMRLPRPDTRTAQLYDRCSETASVREYEKVGIEPQ